MANSIRIAGKVSEYHIKRIYVSKLASVHGAVIGFLIAFLFTRDYANAIIGLIGGYIFGKIAKIFFPEMRVLFLS